MAYQINQGNTTMPLTFLLVQSSDHITGLTGATPTVTISKNGGLFTTPVGTVSETGNGWYKVAANASDADTLGPIQLHATAASADPCDESYEVVNFNPSITVAISPGGLTTRTGQNLLNVMELLNPELQLQPGETDVSKGLLALNLSQYLFENMLAVQPDLLGDYTGNVTTSSMTETTPFPPGVLRIDRLQFLDPTNSRPVFDLFDIRATGGHITTPGWPSNVYNYVSSTGAAGRPVGYYTDGRNIYWTPLPDGAYNVRWYGFRRSTDLIASSTYAYDDSAMLPMATMAVKMIRIGLDDPVDSYQQLAQETLGPVIQMLANFKRERAAGYNYRYVHNT